MIVRSETQAANNALFAQLIKEERIVFERYEVYYRLFGADCTYLIEVTLGCESAFLPAGESLVNAAGLYEKLVKGTVTPCTAKDVWEDLKEK